MKESKVLLIRACLTTALFFGWTGLRAGAASITVDGGQTNQFVDGFGVNANYWNYTKTDLNPVLDALVDQAGMTLFRVVFNNGWEATNDNNDPNVMNQAYYDALYTGPEFQKLWGLLGYLEQKGLSNGIVLNLQGAGPDWMGGSTLTPGMEDEWAEMIVSLLLYARTNLHLQFNLVAPNNEPDIIGEGIYVPTVSQYVTMLEKLAQKLDAYGLGDFRLVVPDRSNGSTNYLGEIMNDPTIMAKVAHFGTHSYAGGGWDTATASALLNQTPFRDRKLWLTEFNVWCDVCELGGQGTNGWEYFRETADYLLDHLASGASAGMVWEGYDSYYPHHSDWSFWGLFAVDDTSADSMTYTPRKGFYTLSQITKFVRPGSRGIGLSGSLGTFKVLAFHNDNLGQVTLTGINTGSSSAGLSGNFISLPDIKSLDLYYTSSVTNLARCSTVQVNNGAFAATIPGDCIFTLTGFDVAKLLFSVQLTAPIDGARYVAPANMLLQATAATSTGSVSKVEFYSGSNKLGEDSTSPYSVVWSNVGTGAYVLSARASNTVGNVATSGLVHVFVPGPLEQIGVTPFNSVAFPNGTQQFLASGTDSYGTVIEPQPVFLWSVSGGGAIDNNGLFTADGGTGGPFSVAASSGSITGRTSIYVSPDLAFEGTGYTWYSLNSATSDSPRAAAPGINDGDLSTDVPLQPGGSVDSANAYEAAGVVWATPQTVRRIVYRNGSWAADDNGVFAADFQLQFSTDGTTWAVAGPEWSASPAYVYNTPFSAGMTFTFQGGANTVRGVRCAGRVHTSESPSPPNSWAAFATEVQVFEGPFASGPPILSAIFANNSVVVSWPVTPDNYVLEAVGDLNQAGAWSAVTNVPQQTGQEWRVNAASTATQQFFRLRQQ